MDVNANYFFKAANFSKPRITNKVGSTVTLLNVMQITGLNTLDISLGHKDYAPLGQKPPHTHSILYVGFITSNPENSFLSKGLIHFRSSPDPHKHVVAIAALSS
jgi:hypothetical protein